MILDESRELGVPSATQLKNSLNKENQMAKHYVKFIFDTSVVTSFNATFNELSLDKSYTLYFITSNEIPFDYATLSPVQSRACTTKTYSMKSTNAYFL